MNREKRNNTLIEMIIECNFVFYQVLCRESPADDLAAAIPLSPLSPYLPSFSDPSPALLKEGIE